MDLSLMMLRNYEFRIYPSSNQQVILRDWLFKCCELYNASVEERRSAWNHLRGKPAEERKGKSPSHYSQNKCLPEIKRVRPEFREVYSQVLQDVLARVQKAYDGFFRRAKLGVGSVGYPRFRSRSRYNSFTYYQMGFALTGTRNKGFLTLSKIGRMSVKNWKDLPAPARIKRVTVKQAAGKWYAILCCEMPEPTHLTPTGQHTGIDVGLEHLVMDARGNSYGDLNLLKRKEQELRQVQRDLSRKKRGSRRRLAAKVRLQKHWQKLVRARKHQQHEIANQLVRTYDVIGVEKLSISSMLRNDRPQPKKMTRAGARGLHRNIGLAGWGQQLQILTYKAEEAGKRVIEVYAPGTSQECSGCHRIVPKGLGERWHECSCGLSIQRDHNSAIVIDKRALQVLRGGGCSKGLPVKREVRHRESRSCTKLAISCTNANALKITCLAFENRLLFP